jgi:(heptosyl)LPS beta-1,4-glucosyltransferase
MPSERPRLSVVMITRDAAQLLERTLGAVGFADSILVVDCGSTDGTCELAERLGATVLVQTEWKGFGYQKNWALERATGEWILVLDADEVVDDELAASIRRVTTSADSADGYRFLRVNHYCGERIRFGHSRPEYVERLFRRGKGRVSDHRVHERVLIDGTVETLKGELHHFTTESLSHRVRKNDEYATTAAEELFRRGKRANLLRLALLLPFSVLRDLVFKGGLLDGRKGVIMAFTGAFYSFSKYAKLWELERLSVDTLSLSQRDEPSTTPRTGDVDSPAKRHSRPSPS